MADPKDKARKEALQDITTRFSKTLIALVVVDALTKVFVLDQYNKTVNRLTEAKITAKVWHDFKHEDLWAEYDEVVRQLGMLSIFSDKFFDLIRNHWDHMLSTFNPNIKY